jgi:lycopene cyclase domain-containing protein
MTYPLFLFLFLIIPIALLLLLLHDRIRAQWWRVAVGMTILIALVYTTPWDNYLVATRVWYYDQTRVWGIVLGYVPLEEYLFVVLQTVLGALVTRALLKRNA